MTATPIYTRNARGHWRVFTDQLTAMDAERRLAGDRRGKAELYTLCPGGVLYVGPRSRRRATRHVVHLMTAPAADLLGFTIPASLTLAPEASGC